MPAAISETIEVDAPPAEAFAYVANFGNLDEWDPTFDSAVRTDTGPLGVGSTFRVATSMAGNDVAGRDDGGTTVTYHAEVDTDAPDWLDTAGTPFFKVVGKLSAAGMRDALSDDRD